MRPISIEFENFGPYTKKQRIDFEKLSKEGIFLICGETGAGKTTVLDAMCYALYGRSSGGERGDFSVMRCKSAGEKDTTYVDYIFECGGTVYRFYREIKFGRKNPSENCWCEKIVGDEHIPLLDNPKPTFVNKKGEEIIGLSYEQFSKVVILPQGKFEKLLTSDSEDKEKILTSIFNADKWDRIVDIVKETAKSEKKKLDEKKHDVELRLAGLDCRTVDELADRIAETNAIVEELDKKIALSETEKKKASDAYDKAVKDNEIFAALEESKRKYEKLSGQSAAFEAKRESLTLADKSDRISEGYTEYLNAVKVQKEAEEKAVTARSKFAAAEEMYSRASAESEAHAAKKAQHEEDKRQLAVMKGAEPNYNAIGNKKSAMAEAEDMLKKRAEDAQKAEEVFKRADAAMIKARDAAENAAAEQNRLNDIYIKNIAGNLAGKLAENEPCPVCGSTSHPMPASCDTSATVTDSELDAAGKRCEKTRADFNRSMAERAEYERKNNEAKELLGGANSAAKVAKAEYEAANSNLLAGISDIAVLEREIKSAERRISEYEQKAQHLEELQKSAASERSMAHQHLNDAENDAEKKKNDLSQASEKWEAALRSAGFESEEKFLFARMDKASLEELRNDVKDYEARLKAAKDDFEKRAADTEGKMPPELALLKSKRDEADNAYTQLSKELSNTAIELERFKKAHKELSAETEKYSEQIARVESNENFANMLDPRSGMSLKKYVLAVMLSSIISATNLLLKNVRNGRYQLYRSEENESKEGGKKLKAGLELYVLDNLSGGGRSVKTLSGGEKFLVSLCLAIGLSTIVQSQSGGINIEAMFIDEGFGTLDSECVSDALGILGSERKSHSVVGIISHVDKLMENIPTRLEAFKTSNGSEIKMIL